MIFSNPQAAYLYLLPALMLVVVWLGKRRKQQTLESFAGKELLPELLWGRNGINSWIRAVIALAAVVLCILALMRPQAGLMEVKEKSKGLDIIVAIDTSRSMLAEDVKPNRLAFAKSMAANLARELKGDRIGLIAFSGRAFLVCPLTVDYNAFVLSLDSLDEHTIPRGGTSLSVPIREAVKGFRATNSKAGTLIMITDGEDHEGDALRAAAEAKSENITIMTLGVGTKEGDLITSLDAQGGIAFLKDRQGRVVKSRLNEVLMKQIATATGGRYMGMPRPDERVYEELFSQLTRQGKEGRTKKQYREWFQVPLLLAMLLVIGDITLAGKRKGA